MNPPIIYVCGPHGSGNRLNGRIVQAGDRAWVVRVFSLPGRFKHPPGDLNIISVRDREMTAQSMLKEGMVRTIEHARQWVDEARGQIVDWKAQHPDAVFRDVVYEETLSMGYAPLIARIANALDAPKWTYDEPIVDGNAKYKTGDFESIPFSDARAKPQ